MNTDKMRTMTLEISAAGRCLPVVTSFVESAAAVFGLQKEEYLRLALAAEEIFMYLGSFVCPGQQLEIQCGNGFYYTRVHFRFAAAALNLSGLNIASGVAYDRPDDLAAMGLLLASRSVDRLQLAVEDNNRVCLSITKEKAYPAAAAGMPAPAAAEKITIETPDAETLKDLAVLTARHYSWPDRPPFFTWPGMLADMVAGGEYSALAAKNQKNEIVGGLVLCSRTEKVVQCFGPYCFRPEQEKEISRALLDAGLAGIARTRALGLLSLCGLPGSLHSDFEALGSLQYHAEGRAPVAGVAFYRLLHEDPGFAVWSAAGGADYLRREYRRLALAREIRIVRDMGETRGGSSLFAAEVSRDQGAVTLRPLLAGDDYQANVARHIRYLRGEGFRNIYFELDLGFAWQAELMDILTDNNFQPAIILPFAGKADLLIFQCNDDDETGS